jgi:hypothetical protein
LKLPSGEGDDDSGDEGVSTADGSLYFFFFRWCFIS